MFAEQMSECRQLAAQAGADLASVHELPKAEQAGAAAGIFNLLKQADDNLQSLQVAARHEAPADRAKLAKEEAVLRADLKATARDLEQARKDLLLGRESGGSTDRLFLAREERSKRATAVTETLRRGSAHLHKANTQALETEEVGVQTLQELRKQREQILGVKDKTAGLGQNLTEAQRAVAELEKQCCVM